MAKRSEFWFIIRKAESQHRWLFINPLSSYAESCSEKCISQVWQSACLYSPKYLCQVRYWVNTLRNRKRFFKGSYLRKRLICHKAPHETTAKQTISAKSVQCLHSRSLHFSRILTALTCMQSEKEVPIRDYHRKKTHSCMQLFVINIQHVL